MVGVVSAEFEGEIGWWVWCFGEVRWMVGVFGGWCGLQGCCVLPPLPPPDLPQMPKYGIWGRRGGGHGECGIWGKRLGGGCGECGVWGRRGRGAWRVRHLGEEVGWWVW